MILYATKVWGGDEARMYNGGLRRKQSALKAPHMTLFLNNSCTFPMELWDSKSVTSFPVFPIIHEVLENYGVSDELFEGGFYYSSAEIMAIEYAKLHGYTHLAWVSSDSLPTSNFIPDAPDAFTVAPKSEVNTWDVDGKDQYFSDQCFLLDVTKVDLRELLHPTSPPIPDYPKHGGNSFEHLMARYMRSKGYYRVILQDHWYDHPV